MNVAITRTTNPGESPIAIRPAPTHTLPSTSSHTSLTAPARNPTGTWSTAEAPEKTDLNRKVSVYERPRSDLIRGSSGTRSAKKRSLQT